MDQVNKLRSQVEQLACICYKLADILDELPLLTEGAIDVRGAASLLIQELEADACGS